MISRREISLVLSEIDQDGTEDSSIVKLRKKLRVRIDAWRQVQQTLFVDFFSSEGLSFEKKSSLDAPEQEHLYLPSSLTPTQIKIFRLDSLALIELNLRQGRMYDAIRSVQFARKACDALNRDKNKNARGQLQKTRASKQLQIPERVITSEIANYNACQAALVALGGSEYVTHLPVMTREDTYRKSTHSRRSPGDSRINNGRIYNTGVTAGAHVRPITSLGNLDPMVGGPGSDAVATQGTKAKPRK